MAAIFTEHANKLVEVANLGCSMSNNDDGVKMVRYAASQIENLCPQVGFEPSMELGSLMAVLALGRTNASMDYLQLFLSAQLSSSVDLCHVGLAAVISPLFAIRHASSTQIMLRCWISSC